MNVAALEAAQSVLLLYVHLTAFCIAYVFGVTVGGRFLLVWTKHVALVATECLSQGYLL